MQPSLFKSKQRKDTSTISWKEGADKNWRANTNSLKSIALHTDQKTGYYYRANFGKEMWNGIVIDDAMILPLIIDLLLIVMITMITYLVLFLSNILKIAYTNVLLFSDPYLLFIASLSCSFFTRPSLSTDDRRSGGIDYNSCEIDIHNMGKTTIYLPHSYQTVRWWVSKTR